MNDFFETIRKFLNEYLPNQRCLSKNTIRSYRKALNLFVKFMREVKGYTVTKIQFSIIGRETLLEFLLRNTAVSTDNVFIISLFSLLFKLLVQLNYISTFNQIYFIATLYYSF